MANRRVPVRGGQDSWLGVSAGAWCDNEWRYGYKHHVNDLHSRLVSKVQIKTIFQTCCLPIIPIDILQSSSGMAVVVVLPDGHRGALACISTSVFLPPCFASLHLCPPVRHSLTHPVDKKWLRRNISIVELKLIKTEFTKYYRAFQSRFPKFVPVVG